MANTDVVFNYRRGGKIWAMYQWLLQLNWEGKGEETMMICYPNAPFHYEGKESYWELDGAPRTHYYQERVYDYPVKTVDGWINLYNNQGYFVR